MSELPTRSERRVARLHELVRIDTVLESYGYQVRADTDREQQFSCDLHGDGTDSKPSARCYPSTNQFYCFACSQSRDAIQLVREKENLSFLGAIEHLEKKYGLPSLPWEEGDREEKPTDEVAAILDAPYADPVRVRAERVIRALTTERADSLSRVLKMWEAFDRARLLEEGGDPEPMRSLLKVVLHHSVT